MIEDILNIISGLFCLLPWCIGVLGLAALFGGMVWFVRRQFRPKGVADLAAERERLCAEVDALAVRLLPWTSDALTDLSTDWDARWSRIARDLNARGTIRSLRDPDGPGWASFALKVRGSTHPDGQLVARTMAHAFEYRFTPEGVEIDAGGAPLGRWLADGSLLDGAGERMGEALRPGGLPVLFRLGGAGTLWDERARSYPLVLRGRTMGRLANPRPQLLNTIRIRKPEVPPAITEIDASDADAETWLLALAIVQVAGWHLLESVWTR